MINLNQEQFFNLLNQLSKTSDDKFEHGIHDIVVLDVDSVKINPKPSYFSDRLHPKIDYNQIGIDHIHFVEYIKESRLHSLLFYININQEYYFIHVLDNKKWARTEAIKAKNIETITEQFESLCSHCPSFEDKKELLLKTMIEIEKKQLEQGINNTKTSNQGNKKIKV